MQHLLAADTAQGGVIMSKDKKTKNMKDQINSLKIVIYIAAFAMIIFIFIWGFTIDRMNIKISLLNHKIEALEMNINPAKWYWKVEVEYEHGGCVSTTMDSKNPEQAFDKAKKILEGKSVMSNKPISIKIKLLKEGSIREDW